MSHRVVHEVVVTSQIQALLIYREHELVAILVHVYLSSGARLAQERFEQIHSLRNWLGLHMTSTTFLFLWGDFNLSFGVRERWTAPRDDGILDLIGNDYDDDAVSDTDRSGRALQDLMLLYSLVEFAQPT